MTAVNGIDDVREWFAAVLAREGAALERAPDGGLFACLPEPLQRALALPDAALLRIAGMPAPGEVEVPLEGAAMQACLERAGSRGALAAARLAAPACGPERARALARSVLQVDNAAVHVSAVTARPSRWLVLEFAWTAAADERESGSVFVAYEPRLRAASASVAGSLHARLAEATPGGDPQASAEVTAAMAAAWPAARRDVEAAVAPFVAAAAARLRRERTRLSAYHDKLLAEARRGRGRSGGAEAKAARLAAIERDRDEKQRELVQRFAIRCDVTVPSVLAVEHDGPAVEFVVRRRARERVIAVALDPWERVGIAPNCESCGVASRVLHACDDAVHLVCMGCKGKRCPVCATADGGRERGAGV